MFLPSVAWMYCGRIWSILDHNNLGKSFIQVWAGVETQSRALASLVEWKKKGFCQKCVSIFQSKLFKKYDFSLSNQIQVLYQHQCQKFQTNPSPTWRFSSSVHKRGRNLNKSLQIFEILHIYIMWVILNRIVKWHTKLSTWIWLAHVNIYIQANQVLCYQSVVW